MDILPHKLRHTAATLMYQGGVDMLALKEILGHENVSTTQIYTHINQKTAAASRGGISLSRHGYTPPRSEEDSGEENC